MLRHLAHTALRRLRHHALALAQQDRVRQPRAWQVLTSVGASLVLVLWACWLGHLALGILHGQVFFYKGQDYTANQAPLRAWLVLWGCVTLAAFSVWFATQSALQAWWRMRRWRGDAVWPQGNVPVSPSLPQLAAPSTQQASAAEKGLSHKPAATVPPLSAGKRLLLQVFGVFLLTLGAYLLALMWWAHVLSWGILLVGVALALGGAGLLFKPEVFRQ